MSDGRDPGAPGEPPVAGAAHTRGGSRPAHRDRDARGVVVRLAAVALVAGVVAAAVAYERAGGGPAAGPPAPATAEAVGPAARPASAGSSTWYCAAGTSSPAGPADHRVLLANPTSAPRHVTLTVVAGDVNHPQGGAGAVPEAVTRDLDLPAGGRREIRLADELAAHLAAAVVEVDGGGVTVEHRVVGPRGADVGPCSPVAADTWHLAWGTTTRDARDLVVLFNPFPSPAAVDASFVTEDGARSPVRWQGFPVPARSVVAVDLDDDVSRSHQVSATFRARTGRIVVERLGLFDGSLGVTGLSLDLGVPEAATAWAFADGGATAPTPVAPEPGTPAARNGGRSARPGLATSEKIVVYNPGTRRAEVDVQLVPDASATGPAAEPFRVSVGPGAFDVVDYGGQARVARGARVGTLVTSTNGVPVVAERVTTDVWTPATRKAGSRGRPSSSRAGATEPTGETAAAPGARLAAADWTFSVLGADGSTGAAAIAVLNPDPHRPVTVRVLPLATGPGARPLVTATVPAGRVAGIRLPPAAAGGVVVRADAPVVAERTLRAGDGRRQAIGPGIPGLAGARPLDELVAGG